MNAPAIYIFCPDIPHPMGGVRMLYRHVDILNANGFDAAIVHSTRGFGIDWFEHSTHVLHGPMKLKTDDIAVFSEIGGLKIADSFAANRKVIFNQNAYYTFARYPLEGRVKTPYLHQEVVATIVVSEDSRQYLQHVFPNLPIHRIRCGIEPRLYFPQEKKKQICFMSRKGADDARQVLYMLRYRKKLEGWIIREIQNVPQARAAEIIRESAIFMSFGAPEGFGLPPAEAMAAHCIVVGYHGNGGREFFTPNHGFPIELGDILGYARTMERVLEEYSRDPTRLKQTARDAGRFVRDTYSPQAETDSILECWRTILA